MSQIVAEVLRIFVPCIKLFVCQFPTGHFVPKLSSTQHDRNLFSFDPGILFITLKLNRELEEKLDIKNNLYFWIDIIIFQSLKKSASLCAKRTLYNRSGLFRAIVIKRSYCWRCFLNLFHIVMSLKRFFRRIAVHKMIKTKVDLNCHQLFFEKWETSELLAMKL